MYMDRVMGSWAHGVNAKVQQANDAQRSHNVQLRMCVRALNRALRCAFSTWRTNSESSATERVCTMLRHTQIEYLVAAASRVAILREVFAHLSTCAETAKCRRRNAATMCTRVCLRDMNELLDNIFRDWLASVAESTLRNERRAAQTRIDEFHKELESCRRDLAEARLSVQSVEQDLEECSSELASEKLQRALLQDKNKKRYLSQQHLAARTLRRDLLRCLSLWHARVNLVKRALVKIYKRCLVISRTILVGVVDSWLALVSV